MKSKTLNLVVFISAIWLMFYFITDKNTLGFYYNKYKNGTVIKLQQSTIQLNSEFAIYAQKNNYYGLKKISDFSKDFILTSYKDLGYTLEDALSKNAFIKITQENSCVIYQNLFESKEVNKYFIYYIDLKLVIEFFSSNLSNEEFKSMCSIVAEVITKK